MNDKQKPNPHNHFDTFIREGRNYFTDDQLDFLAHWMKIPDGTELEKDPDFDCENKTCDHVVCMYDRGELNKKK